MHDYMCAVSAIEHCSIFYGRPLASLTIALQPLFKAEHVKGQLAFGKPAIVKRKSIDSYNLQYAVWNNKIIKDGEPQGADH